MNILAFAGSNSRKSINKQLVTHIAQHYWKDDHVEILDLNDYDLQLFGVDFEAEHGIPEAAERFAKKIDEADLILLSLAEHNGAYSAVFKNLFDWLSRIPERSAWMNKPMFLMGTSPGGRGAKGVLDIAVARFPFNGGNVVATFSLPFFPKNFDPDQGVINTELRTELESIIDKIKTGVGQ